MNKLRKLFMWWLLAVATHAMGVNITVNPIEIEAGGTANLVINMQNTETDLTAYQMSLYLPNGISIQKADGDYAYTANADRHDGAFTVTVKDAADGSVLIACFSANKDVLTGTSGELIRLPLDVASTVTTSLQGSIKNVEFTNVSAQAIKPEDISFTITMITKEEQTLSLSTIPEMTYGDAEYTLPQKTAEGLDLTWSINNESVAKVSGNTLTVVGAGTAVVTAIQAGNKEYKPFFQEFALTVNKAMLTITADNCTKQEGEPNPELTVSYSGFKYDDDASSLIIQPTVTTTATISSSAGTYPISVSGAASDTYEFTYVSGELTVTAAPLPVTNDYLYCHGAMMHSGNIATVEVSLANESELVAFEFWMQLPAGFSLVKTKNKWAVLDSEREDGHTLTVSDEGNGKYHFLCYSNPLSPFIGTDGVLLSMTVQPTDEVEPGTYEGVISDISFSDVNKQRVRMNNAVIQLVVNNVTKGDLNDDGEIDVMDIVEMVDCIMKHRTSDFILLAGDFDNNGEIDVMDIVEMVSLIMTKGGENARESIDVIDPE